MNAALIVTWAAVACAIALLGFGLTFLFASDFALDATAHRLETLPYVMAGRYFFFGVLLLLALFHRDLRVLTALLIGFAGLGFFDAMLYRNAQPLPHAAVGMLALGAAFLFWKGGQVPKLLSTRAKQR